MQQLKPLLRPSLLFDGIALEGSDGSSAGRKTTHMAQIADTTSTIDVPKKGNAGAVVRIAVGKKRERRKRKEQE